MHCTRSAVHCFHDSTKYAPMFSGKLIQVALFVIYMDVSMPRAVGMLRFFTLLFPLVIGLVTMPSALAETYKGRLGKYPIMLETQEYGASSYIYTRHYKRIFLRGDTGGVEVILSSIPMSDEEPKETFDLYLHGEGLEGKWRRGNTTLPVKLAPTKQTIAEYQRQHRQWVVTGRKKYAGLTLEQVKERHSGFSLFRLGDGFSQAQRDYLNPLLRKAQEDVVEDIEQCELANYGAKVSLVNEHFLSYSISYENYCGGAHPNHGELMWVYDLQNLKRVNSPAELYPDADYLRLLQTKYGDDLQGPECDYFSHVGSHWRYAQWRLTPEGLVIIPSFAHAMAPCEVPLKLSYDELAGKTPVKPSQVFE